MIPFIIVFIITILSMMYVNRLIKLKFKHEENCMWKIIHIIAYIIVFIPLLVVAYLVTEGNLIEIGILTITIITFLYLSFKKYNKI
ncbi:hypothetical protein [Clostridium sp. C2-6-12]|uniref:hypothetical protein n=1 Tax=Clostridium sp. C2-6-12 TaxID=2698832 RepID=UPI001368F89A|nr:hypothetical protein [Clostridium sp. C2-6-12]